MLDLRDMYSEIKKRKEIQAVLFGIYKSLEEQFGEENITSSEHGSGFPAIVVYANHKPVFITDILSAEEYFRWKKSGKFK